MATEKQFERKVQSKRRKPRRPRPPRPGEIKTKTVRVAGQGVATFEFTTMIDGRFVVDVVLLGLKARGVYPGPELNALQLALRAWDKKYGEGT